MRWVGGGCWGGRLGCLPVRREMEERFESRSPSPLAILGPSRPEPMVNVRSFPEAALICHLPPDLKVPIEAWCREHLKVRVAQSLSGCQRLRVNLGATSSQVFESEAAAGSGHGVGRDRHHWGEQGWGGSRRGSARRMWSGTGRPCSPAVFILWLRPCLHPTPAKGEAGACSTS